jgi:hypothetical protein
MTATTKISQQAFDLLVKIGDARADGYSPSFSNVEVPVLPELYGAGLACWFGTHGVDLVSRGQRLYDAAKASAA